MKLKLVAFIFTLFVTTSFAQVKVPGHIFDSKSKKFDFTTNIKNTGKKAISFYVLPNDPELKNALRNDSSLIAYLTNGLDENAEKSEKQIQLIKKVGNLIKSIYFKKDKNLFPEENLQELYSLKYSPMGMFWGQYVKGFGEFFKGYSELLIQTGYFTIDDLRAVFIDNYSMGEVKVNDAWILVDVNPKNPGFMHENKKSPNGYASLQDLANDTSLFQEYKYSPWWKSDYSYSLSDNLDEKFKRELIKSTDSRSSIPLIRPMKPESMSGEFVLCPGCEIRWEESGYFLDLNDKTSKNCFDSLNTITYQITNLSMNNQMTRNKMMAYLDKMINVLDNTFPSIPDIDDVDSLMSFINYKLYVKYPHHLERFAYRNAPLSTLKILSPEMGFVKSDLEAPFFILNSNAEKSLSIDNDELSEESEFQVWMGKEDSSSLSSKIYYLQDCSSNGKVEITTSYNPVLMPFSTGFELLLKDPEDAKILKIGTDHKK